MKFKTVIKETHMLFGWLDLKFLRRHSMVFCCLWEKSTLFSLKLKTPF